MAAAVGESALTGRYARTRLAYEVLDADGRRYGETEEVDAVTPLYTVALRLRPGRYRVKVAAKDAEGRIGSVEHPFEVTPAPAEGIHVGGALLFRDTGEASTPDPARRRAGQRSAPSASTCSCTARRRRRWTASAANVDVTHLDEQVSRFNGPMGVTCDKVGTGCELDASFSPARWPAGRYRADVAVRQGRLGDRAHRAHVRRRRRCRSRPATSTTTTATPSPAVPRSAQLDAVLSRATGYADTTRRAPCRRCPRSTTSRPSSTAR